MTKMRIARIDRPRVKLEILRMIATLKLDKARAALIGMFMESCLKLTKADRGRSELKCGRGWRGAVSILPAAPG
jgi:hypothetical protein